MPLRLCGKTAAEHIYQNITNKINRLLSKNIVPGLTVIQVGEKRLYYLCKYESKNVRKIQNK